MRPNRTMPDTTVMPILPYPDVTEAIAWLTDAFQFTERWRAGDHRAQLAVGENGAVVVTERGPDRVGPADIMVRVDDADAHHAHARDHGATIVQPPRDFPYGERQYDAVDLGGHRWLFSQRIADVAPEDWGGTSSS